MSALLNIKILLIVFFALFVNTNTYKLAITCICFVPSNDGFNRILLVSFCTFLLRRFFLPAIVIAWLRKKAPAAPAAASTQNQKSPSIQTLPQFAFVLLPCLCNLAAPLIFEKKAMLQLSNLNMMVLIQQFNSFERVLIYRVIFANNTLNMYVWIRSTIFKDCL